jgi:hypothetical protein
VVSHAKPYIKAYFSPTPPVVSDQQAHQIPFSMALSGSLRITVMNAMWKPAIPLML